MKKFIFINLILIANIFANSPVLLLVGSTFDYPPLNYIESGNYQGHDIKIIEEFAKDNNYKIQFVKTTWPTLTDDLLKNKFYVAIGGISYNEQRKSLFLLSDPIGYFRKVAVIRCNDSDKFDTESKINRPGIRIVENIGGTNQKFAEDLFGRANIIIVQNNQLPFSILSSESADVMFTDNIEAEYVHKNNPKLCVAKLDQTFPSTNKVVLFKKTHSGKDAYLKFNKWWPTHKKDFD